MNAHTAPEANAELARRPHMAWTGSRMIDVRDPDPADIIMSEIATGLSRETRYGGAATIIPWSVGQHSLLMLGFAREDGMTSRELLLTILLHDSPEYMLRDLIRPVKAQCKDYQRLEKRWWIVIALKYDLPFDMPGIVKHYDNLAAASEKAALISPEAGEWPGLPAPREIPTSLLTLTSIGVDTRFMVEVGALLPGRV